MLCSRVSPFMSLSWDRLHLHTCKRRPAHATQREMSDAQMHTPVCAILDEAKAAGCLQWKNSGGCVVEATDEMWKHHHGLKKRLKVESCRGSQVCSSVFFRWMIFYSVCSAALQKRERGVRLSVSMYLVLCSECCSVIILHCLLGMTFVGWDWDYVWDTGMGSSCIQFLIFC